MLIELAVRDLGVIRSLSLVLGPGLTALTGETGAGKTLVVDAIDLLLGGRSDGAAVRTGADEARVEGRFVVDGEEVVLGRVVPRTGRSRAYVDGHLATATRLTEIGAALVDLHGQHAHQSLLRAAAQREALDGYSGIDTSPLREARARVVEIDAELATLGGDDRTRARELDLLRYQVAEIEAAAVDGEDEDSRLAREEDVLADAQGHREAGSEAADAVGGDGGAAEVVARAADLVAGRSPYDELEARLRSAAAELVDVGSELRAATEAIDDDPARIELVRARRELLRQLTRKYGADLVEVAAFEAEARARIEELASHEERAAALDAARADARADLAAEAALVGAARRAAAPDLAAAVEGELAALAMPGARVQIDVEGDGGESVTIELAANPGSEAKPLASVVSGGELARTMLALRLVGVEAGPSTLVFDEVDAGIGGQAATAVGRALRAVAVGDRQVLVVTHLAQVAVFADEQIAVTKFVDGENTETTASLVEGDDRVDEVSRMLSGTPDRAAARIHARDLLDEAGIQPAPKVGD